MGLAGILWRISVLVAFIAAIFLLPALKPHREKLSRLFATCPLHWFQSPAEETGIGSGIIKTGNHPIFTKEELSKYDGTEESLGLYIGIYGRVYDVSNGKDHYGPGGSYSFFAGCDGTRAFVTGEFNEKGLVDDVTEFDSSRLLDLLTWVEFYEKTYRFVGKLIGNFYDTKGNPTEALREAEAGTNRALEEKRLTEEERKIFPPCNSHWSEATGSKLWCSTKSGGIERDWEGVPRQFFDLKFKRTRCVCVRSTGSPSLPTIPDNGNGDLNHPNLSPYENCDPLSNTCMVQS